MEPDVAAKFFFILLAFNAKLIPTLATKIDYLDRIDTTKMNNMSTFSFLCQDQMVKIESKIYHLDRLRSSLKSGYLEKLFTSDDFKQKINPIMEIQPPNGEVFPAVVDLIRGKELSDVLNKDNYIPLLEAMDHFKMEIDLENFDNCMEQNLRSYSLQESKIFELYKFIRKNSKFEYLLENVFKHFAIDLTTPQNHTIYSSLPLEHLIRIINKVGHPNDKKRHAIIQLCTEWLCHDMENRLFHMGKLVTSIESTFRSAIETNTVISKHLPKCVVNEQSKRKLISRCLFALLAGKNFDYRRLDEYKSHINSKSLSPQDAITFKFYHSFRKNSTLNFVLDGVFNYFATNLETLQNHKMFPSLPFDHLVQIIKNIRMPNNEIRYRIIQMSTEWLCYDMENRLPHLVNLVITAKSLFHSSVETINNDSNCLPRCHVDEKLKRRIISSCLWALLTNGEKLNTKLLADDDSNYHSDDGYYSEDDKSKSYSAREYMRFVHRNDEDAKLKKFLNNSDFYDITVRVGEMTYKLHRAILESKCGYFKNIFRVEYAKSVACHEMPKCPSKDKEYLLEEPIDSSTFAVVIDYIYFGNFVKYGDWTDKDVIFRTFLTTDALKIQDERLSEHCKEILMDDYVHKKMDSQNTIRILYSIYGKMKHEDLYLLYLCNHMTAKWPNIYNMSHFCSISWTMLENMLKSSDFQLGHRNPQKILDICSIWISHNVKNRYHFLPRITKIINPYCVPDHDKYTTDVAAELNDTSLQFVKDKLWEILSSLPYNIQSADLSKNTSRKLKETPAFIATNSDKNTIDVFIVGLGLLESFNVSELPKYLWLSHCQATLIGHNLFVLLTNFYDQVKFLVYNFVLKECFPLRFDFEYPSAYNLLNCNNEVYVYTNFGHLLKYSLQLNRWMIIHVPVESNKNYFKITSNGETIFRIREQYTWKNVIDAYNFENNSWYLVPNLPILDCHLGVYKLSVVNDHEFAVSNSGYIYLLFHDSNTWREYRSPDTSLYSDPFVTQQEDRILFFDNSDVYRFFPSNESFKLIEGLPQKYKESKYGQFNVIHRIVRTHQ